MKRECSALVSLGTLLKILYADLAAILGSSRVPEPKSGPTPGGNNIQIETREGSMDSSTITRFFVGSEASEESPLIIVEERHLDGPCTRAEDLSVQITEPGCEELRCNQHYSRVEKKGPPGYHESNGVTGEVQKVKEKLLEISTVLEKSDSLDQFLDLFPSAFKIRRLLNSEAGASAKVAPESFKKG
ncbi:unnamed protein product [Symbiodinium natans]|uniref:Uncharacterized protein n=1 Tax=Symbiodinium natans TaxID=878477 RepID=A0A812PW75_9DINO|nr:unnamed protein product [Symbiodinium natans]